MIHSLTDQTLDMIRNRLHDYELEWVTPCQHTSSPPQSISASAWCQPIKELGRFIMAFPLCLHLSRPLSSDAAIRRQPSLLAPGFLKDLHVICALPYFLDCYQSHHSPLYRPLSGMPLHSPGLL